MEPQLKKMDRGRNIVLFLGVVMAKKLIISPHIDDEILGCGGTISKFKNTNED